MERRSEWACRCKNVVEFTKSNVRLKRNALKTMRQRYICGRKDPLYTTIQ